MLLKAGWQIHGMSWLLGPKPLQVKDLYVPSIPLFCFMCFGLLQSVVPTASAELTMKS